MIERRSSRVSQCIHHWMIDENNIGTCKKCGDVKDFRTLLAKEGRKKSPQQLLSLRSGGIDELPPEVHDRLIVR